MEDYGIKHPDADRLARELAAKNGESLTDAVVNAVRERLRREATRRKALSAHDSPVEVFVEEVLNPAYEGVGDWRLNRGCWRSLLRKSL